MFLTEEGRGRISEVDKAWKRLEKEALAGLDDKDRKRLRKLLRTIEKNLAAAGGFVDSIDEEADDLDEPATV